MIIVKTEQHTLKILILICMIFIYVIDDTLNIKLYVHCLPYINLYICIKVWYIHHAFHKECSISPNLAKSLVNKLTLPFVPPLINPCWTSLDTTRLLLCPRTRSCSQTLWIFLIHSLFRIEVIYIEIFSLTHHYHATILKEINFTEIGSL